MNDHLAEVLREPLRELIPSDEAFLDVFDRFEYLLSLAYADLAQGDTVGESAWASAGSYAWRHRHDRGEGSFWHAIEVEAREAPAPFGWEFLRGPLFGGSLDRFLKVKTAVDAYLRSLPIW